MKRLSRIALFIFTAACAAGAAAQNSPPRAGKWEFTLQPQYVHGQTFDTGNGSSGTVDSALGFGFGVAYNLNNNFSLGGDFFWNSANYTANFGSANGSTPYSASGTLQTSTIRFNGVWNIMSGDFTPLIMGGIGSTYIDTNIPTAPPTNSCWWDPWWGYYCGTYYPTKTAYYVTYSAGVGARYDLDRNVFLRAMAIRQWLDASSALGTIWTDQYRFDVGFKF